MNGVTNEDRTSTALIRRWYTVAEVAEMLGFGQSKVRMLVITGDLKSLKDGRARRILPEWVDEYIALRKAQAEQPWDAA